MARRAAAAGVAAALVVVLWAGVASAAVYEVGDKAGWTVMGKPDYASWASSKTFHPGDIVGSASLMASLREIPPLKGDNYVEWKRKIDFAFTIAEVDWVLTEPCPTVPVEPVRETSESDDAWDKRKKDFGPIRMAYDIKHARWVSDNKKCCAVIENTIEPALVGSIEKCDTATGYFERIKNQFTGSSKVYATHLFKQLTNEKYKGGGIRDHILKMSHLANKLKAMDLEIQPQLLIHFVFASLPKEFDNFVINYNMQPEKWDLDKLIAQCVDEELRINGQQGGQLNYIKGKGKKPYNPGSPAKKGPMQQKPQFQQQGKPQEGDNTCWHCGKEGHKKTDCPGWLKDLMKRKGLHFDENYAKKRKFH